MALQLLSAQYTYLSLKCNTQLNDTSNLQTKTTFLCEYLVYVIKCYAIN